MANTRLPTPGQDDGKWGDILNDFLQRSHNDDGTLKDNIITATQLAPNAVTSSSMAAAGGSDGDVLTKNSQAASGVTWQTLADMSTPDATGTTKGIIKLAGDLAGTADAPTVPALDQKVDQSALSPVALSGSYTDLVNKPSTFGYDFIGSTMPSSAQGLSDGMTWLQTAPGGGQTPQFVGDFETGSTSQWTFQQGATVDRTHTYRGMYGCRLAPDPTTNYACLTCGTSIIPQGHPWASISFRFRLIQKTATSKTYTNLFEIGNTLTQAPKGQFTIYTNNGALVADFNTSDMTVVDPNPSVGEWHLLEARVFFGATAFQAYIRYDGRLLPMKISDNTQTAASVQALWVGYASTVTDQTVDVDDVRLWVGDIDGGFLNTLPALPRYYLGGAWV